MIRKEGGGSQHLILGQRKICIIRFKRNSRDTCILVGEGHTPGKERNKGEGGKLEKEAGFSSYVTMGALSLTLWQQAWSFCPQNDTVSQCNCDLVTRI